MVPKASAEQAATLAKWEYVAVKLKGDDADVIAQANKLGGEAWEMCGSVLHHGSSYSWFKRARK
jgi:hypothetical protein